MNNNPNVPAAYLDYSGRDDVLSGGIKMIPIETSKGVFRVWTKRIGNHPTMKVLLCMRPACHEYLEAFDSYSPAAWHRILLYDQLGSYYSDQPKEPELVDLERCGRGEQDARHLGWIGELYLYGQSWGGLLAIEYALKYQQNLKSLIISQHDG